MGTVQKLAEKVKAGFQQTVLLSRDQTDLGDRCAVLMVGLPVGDRSRP
jgi:hypothetical protein